MISLVQLTEKNIPSELNDKNRAFLSDGWSAMNTHFSTVIFSYCTSQIVRDSNSLTENSVPRLNLPKKSPLSQQDSLSDDEFDDTTRINAQCYVQF